MTDRNDDKSKPRRTTPIEDRLWPINLVLVVLGAFLIGVTLAFVSFDNPVWYANGWLHVTAVTLLIGGWIAAANLVKNQFVKRSMQSAAGISLAIHVVLVILLVFSASTPPDSAAKLLTKKAPTPRRPRTEFRFENRRPAENIQQPTATPDAAIEASETAEPERVAEMPPPTTSQPVAPPSEAAAPRPPTAMADVPRRAESQPGGALHRAETLSRLSRQMTPRQVRGSGVAADVPRPSAANENAGGETGGATAEIARQAPTGPVGTPTRVEKTAPSVAADAPRASRASGAEASAARGEGGARVARSNSARQTPQAIAAAAGRRAPGTASTTETPGPADTATERSTPGQSSTPATSEASAPTPTAVVAGAAAPRQQAAEAAPQQAVAAIPAAERRQPAKLPLAAPVVADVPSRSVAGNSGTVASNMSDLTPGVGRQSTGASARGPGGVTGANAEPSGPMAGSGGVGRAGTTRVASGNREVGESGGGGPVGRRGAAGGPAIAATAGRIGAGGGRGEGGSVGDGLPGPTGGDVARQSVGAAPLGGADVRPGGGTARDVARSGAGAASGGGLARAPLGASSDVIARSPQGGSPSRATGGGATRPNLLAAAAGGDGSVGTGQGGEVSALPAASAVVRQTTSGPPAPAGAIGGAMSREPAPSETTAIAPQVARAGSGRGAGNGVGSGAGGGPSSLNPLGRAGGAPSRAANTAVATASPRPVESPSLGGGGSGSNPLGEPSRVAVSRGERGVAGGGMSPNFGNAEPSGGGGANIASGSFARANTRSDGPVGAAVGGDGSSTTLARGAASRGTTASSLAATSSTAGAGGGQGSNGELADNATSAGAAIIRGDANGPGGAAAGSAGAAAVDVDFGPTQVVAEAGGTGAGPGGNGGQPLLNAELAAGAGTLARREAGSAPTASLAATTVGEVAAPAGMGGGEAGGLDPLGAGLAAVRTDGSGGTGVTSGGPTTEAPIGPVAGANVGDDVGPAFAARGGGAESLPGDELAGGGDPGAGLAGNLGRATFGGRGPGVTTLAAESGQGAGGGSGGDASGVGPDIGELASTKVGGGEGTAASGGPSSGNQEIGGAAGGVGGTLLARAGTQGSGTGDAELAGGAGRTGSLGRATSAPGVNGGGLQAEVGALVADAGTGAAGGVGESDAGGLATARTTGSGGASANGGGAEVPAGIAAAGGIPAAELVGQLQVGRVEGIDAAAGFAQGGGGTGGVTRAASGAMLAGPTLAETSGGGDGVDATAGPSDRLAGDGAGAPDAAVVRAAGSTTGTDGGLAAGGADEAIAGAAGSALAGSPTGGIVRSVNAGGSDLSGTGAGQVGPDGVGRTATAAGARAGLQAEAAGTGGASSSLAGAGGNGGLAPDWEAAGEANRQQGGVGAGGLVVDVDAPEGPGGLGEEYALDAGFATRRSQTDSRELQIQETRFIRNEPGGIPATAVNVALSSDAYRERGRRPGRGIKGGVGASKTEDTVELGLGFLARHQSSDGRWSLHEFGGGKKEYAEELTAVQLRSDTAATGLSLLSFLGAGYHHQEDVYRDHVRRGLEWLVKNQKENGDLYVPADDKSNSSAWLYSHGIGTLALCEAYGMTQDPQLKEPAQRAINFIVQSQQQSRGGWRYKPNEGSDLSVTGWITTALKSGALAGLDVPPETFAKVDVLLNQSQGGPREQALYVYNPLAPDTDAQRHGRSPSRSMTSVGLLLRLYSGWHRDNPAMQRGADYILQDLPAAGTTRKPQRDTYYWYYATQVMYHMGGRHWQAWNGKLHPLLVESQVKSGPLRGSWDARGPVPDRWGPQAGRIYVTALNLLSLEVSYRHLPLYEDQAK